MKAALSKKLFEYRWAIAVGFIVLLSVTTIGSAGYAVTLGRRVSASDNLRASEAKAERIRRASEKRAAKLRAEAECRVSIATSAQGTTIIEDLRSTYLGLADLAVNPNFAVALRQRAKNLPKFPPPECDPGIKPKVPS